MTEKFTLSDLLAYRDGELENRKEREDVEAAIAQDPGLADQLQRSIELRHELNRLPAEVPAPELWQQLQAAVSARVESDRAAGTPEFDQPNLTLAAANPPPPAPPTGNGWFSSPQLRLATAASVFLVGLLASGLWMRDLPGANPTAQDGQIALQTPVQTSEGLETLLDRSRRLEEVVQSQVVSAGAEPSSAQRALMFRIADLDAELNSLQQEAMHPDLKERLWRQRVELLETLMEIQRFQMHNQADF